MRHQAKVSYFCGSVTCLEHETAVVELERRQVLEKKQLEEKQLKEKFILQRQLLMTRQAKVSYFCGSLSVLVKKLVCYGIVYHYNCTQRYEQFLQVGHRCWALILLGLVLCRPSASLSSIFMVLYT